MRNDIPEHIFKTRGDFRHWLIENAQTSEGVWLTFGKTKTLTTLTAKDALEEALCFGWIDGQMKSIDETKYRKYFARRQAKSAWSDKNKKIVESLRERGLMAESGEKAVQAAKQNGMWENSPSGAVTAEQTTDFEAQLAAHPQAFENYANMPQSAKTTYVRRYFSFKREETRQRDLEKIIDLLNQNLKPSIKK